MLKHLFLVAFVGIIFNRPLQGNEGATFETIWDVIGSDVYEELPQNKVTLKSFFRSGVDLLLNSSKRTIKNDQDLLPRFNKLLHPNGICMKGTWTIEKENSYGGYFRAGSEALVIARGSTTLSETERGQLRGFGLSGKIFPTQNPHHNVKTANFFTIDNLAGTRASHFTKVRLTNEPKLLPSPSFSIFSLFGIGLKVAKTFGLADKKPGIRQLYPISFLGDDKKTALTPKWMMLEGDPYENRSQEKDFRNELKNHIAINGRISFNISVSSHKNDGKIVWNRIGHLRFYEAVASDSCDHKLHFQHPKFIYPLK